MMSHCECSDNEEIKSTTSTQYVMSGSTPAISKVKGGSQVRERAEFEAVILKSSTAERRPRVKNYCTNWTRYIYSGLWFR